MTRERQPKWQPAFLTALRNSGNIRAACQAAGITRAMAYHARKTKPVFAAEWDEAMNDAIDLLEAAAWQRARTQQSDTLTIFLLKSHRREVYGDRVDVTVELRETAERIAEQTGIDANELIREAERIAAMADRGRRN